MKTVNYIVLSVLFLCCACKSGNASGKENKTVEEDTLGKDTIVLKPITTPEIPAMFTEPEQRANFMVEHYWDHFNFTDTNYIDKPDITEQTWANYISLLPHVPFDIVTKSLNSLYQRAEQEPEMYYYFNELAEKYFYDPNSPFRSEEYYIIVLEHMVNTKVLSDIEKVRPADRLKMALKNRVGEKAANFTYTLESGKQGTLYQVRSKYTLLFFNNPGCTACEEAINQMKYSLAITEAVMNKTLTILAIYPDEDMEEWKNHLKDFPKEWINGYDKEFVINDTRLYDVRAIPSIYLLDKDKKIIFKDTTIQTIDNYLHSIL